MTDPTYQQLNDYTHYLQGQVQKFSAFMLTQKKLNEKHVLIQNVVNEIMLKIQKVQDKLKIIEINEKDNLYEMKKIRAEKQALKSMEIRIQNIQHEISSLFKSQGRLSIDQSSQYEPQKVIEEKPKTLDKKQTNGQKNQNKNFTQLSQQNLDFIEKYLSNVFLEKQEAHQMILQAKEEIEFKVKKLQIEIQKNKESFLKLTSQINSFSNRSYFQSPFQKQAKGEKRLHTQSTKDLNIEPISQQNIITKKELKKMQKKLETFFSEKLTEIQSQNQNKQSSTNINQKDLKFKRIQQKYDRLTAETTHHNQIKSERKIDIDDKKSSSQKKLSLFDNQILRQKHGIRNQQVEVKSKQKRKSKNQIQSPLKLMESPRYGKGFNSSKSQQKKITKRRSPDRLKRVNQDYMISQ